MKAVIVPAIRAVSSVGAHPLMLIISARPPAPAPTIPGRTTSKGAMRKILATALIMMMGTAAWAADTARVLFIGNSYTYVNDLPLMLKNLAVSNGDVVIYDGHLIGGYTLQQHSTNATTIAKIAAGGWDYVVVQEQSQFPSFPDAQVAADVYPYARKLDSLIRRHNPCAETIFYNTWGRKNGDASNCAFWPPVCSYAGMDSLLRLRYGIMAAANQGIVAPVGPVWRRLRTTSPAINLYDADESHPSPEGTYAAACTFYAVIFRKDPATIAFGSGLPAASASAIRLAAKAVAFDSLAHWKVGSYDPEAAFSHTLSGATAQFSNNSQRSGSYLWIFGDGQTSTLASPSHSYSSGGTYQVKLVAGSCGRYDTATSMITVTKTAAVAGTTTDMSITAYFDAYGSLRLDCSRPLNAGSIISVFNPEGRTLSRVSMGAPARSLRLEMPQADLLYVVTVEDPKGGVSWRQMIRR